MELNYAQQVRRPHGRCNATEDLLRSGLNYEAGTADSPTRADEISHLDPQVLDAHLLRVSTELTKAMLALRPSSSDAPPDPADAYDRMHAAMSDLAGVYQYSQLQQLQANTKTVERGSRRGAA
jgi:hypothetical protein